MEVCPAPNFHPHFARRQSLQKSQNLQTVIRDLLHKIDELHMGQKVTLDLSDIDALEQLLREVSESPSAYMYQDRVQFILESGIKILNDMTTADKQALRTKLPDESLSNKQRFLRRLLSSREDLCQNLSPAGLQNLVDQMQCTDDTSDVFRCPTEASESGGESRKSEMKSFDELQQNPKLRKAKSWHDAFEEVKAMDSEDESELGDLPWDLPLSNIPSPPASEPQDISENECKQEHWFEEVGRFVDFAREEECDTTDMATGSNDGSDADREFDRESHRRSLGMQEVADGSDGFDECDIQSVIDIECGEPMQYNMFPQEPQIVFVPFALVPQFYGNFQFQGQPCVPQLNLGVEEPNQVDEDLGPELVTPRSVKSI